MGKSILRENGFIRIDIQDVLICVSLIKIKHGKEQNHTNNREFNQNSVFSVTALYNAGDQQGDKQKIIVIYPHCYGLDTGKNLQQSTQNQKIA